MRRLSDTLARLAAAQRLPASQGGTPAGRLDELTGFGANPGDLAAWCHVPDDLPPHAPLVVALHGCTQDAATYDHGTGWSTLADRAGFAVLLPEQRRRNNGNMCFNWFESADIARTGGEAQSIAEMVEAMIARHGLDPARVFVTGLSAGGAMTAVMLATRPEMFAAGAIIGGLPYGGATSVSQALDRMRGHGWADDARAADAVRRAGAAPVRWPRVAIWHGTADHTVVPANAERLAAQWRTVHGLPLAPDAADHGARWHHSRWNGGDGQPLVDLWMVEGMGHGVPIATGGTAALGATGPFMLDVGLSSTEVIARSWGLMGAEAMQKAAVPRAAPMPSPKRAVPMPPPAPAASSPASPLPAGIGEVIERALRAAGLSR
jgi:poly(hydroxyalkanoate) depolymerase family esterase